MKEKRYYKQQDILYLPLDLDLPVHFVSETWSLSSIP
jgi:hypothetical protein